MKAILKQTSWLFFAQALTRVVAFFYVIFLARTLGVEDFGLYSVALAYFAIISSIADFGFNRFLTREVARDKSKAPELLCNIVMLRLTLTSVFFAVFAVILYILDPDKMRVSLILLATISILPQAVAVTFDAIFVALQKLQFSAISLIFASLTTAICGFLLVSRGFGVMGAVNAVIFGQLVYAVVLILFLYYKNGGLHFTQITLSVLKKALMGSLPYCVLSVLGLVYFRIDTILLSYLKGNFDTGIYGAGYKFLEALVFIPNALSFALFPKFVKLHETYPQKIRKLISQNIKLMFLLGVVVTVLYITILPQVIKIFLPNYLRAISVIQILSFSIPFMFVHVPASTVLTSSDKYLKKVILLSIVPLLANVILNLIFIPQFGFIAAAYITVFSDILSVLLLLVFINKLIPKS